MRLSNRFFAGQVLCMITLEDADVCLHCVAFRDEGYRGPELRVTVINDALGTVTFAQVGDDE